MADKQDPRVFSPLDLLLGEDAVRTIEVPGLGLVRYKPLSTRDALELSKEKLDPAAMAAKEAWSMLCKADPDFAAAMPFERFVDDETNGRAVSQLVYALSMERDFRGSKSGSHPTAEPSRS